MFCFVWLQALLKELEQSLVAKALQEQEKQRLEVNIFFSPCFLALDNLNKQG